MSGNSKDEAFGPILDGITLPDTVVLPPEVAALLPWTSLAELKVVIAAVARLMQVGGAEPITLSEFETMTGLDRKSVLVGIERAMKRGLLMRFEMTGYRGHTMHVYELKPRFIGGNFPPITPVKAKQSKDVVVNEKDSVNGTDSVFTATNLTLLNLSADENFSQKTPENAQKNALFERLHKVGIYTKTGKFLLENFPAERIEKCLALYPLARRVGRADGPGWLVRAISDPSWDLDVERADLEERLAAQSQAVEKPRGKGKQTGSGLPRGVLADLQKIGWNGSTTELVEHYRSERKAFKAWLDWAKRQPPEYAAARFLTGLRSGILPPVEKLQTDNRRRYIEGPYADIIQH